MGRTNRESRELKELYLEKSECKKITQATPCWELQYSQPLMKYNLILKNTKDQIFCKILTKKLLCKSLNLLMNLIFTCKLCQIKSCNRKIPYNITATIITCPSGGATQETKSCKKAMSARLYANVDNSETWFTAFTDVWQKLLNQDKESNLTSDQISQALLSIENVTMLVDATSNYIRHREI